MHYWIHVSLYICLFGFLKEIRPSDPHTFYDFLVTKGITLDQVNQDIVPVKIYMPLCSIIIVFLITDFCRYKPLIILHGLSAITGSCLFVCGKTLRHFQIAAAMVGISEATEVAYFTYIYAKVEKEFYRRVTSFTIAAVLAGKFVSGGLSQLLVSTKSMNYTELHYISITFMSLATIWSFFLPPVEHSPYFHQEGGNVNSENEEEQKLTRFQKCCSAFILLKQHIVACFSNTYVLKWLLWLTLSSGIFIIVNDFVQSLWGEVGDNENHRYPYNGAANALCTLVGFLTALGAGALKTDYTYKVELLLTVGSLLLGFVTIIASQAATVLVCFACYITYGGIFYFLSVAALSEIVKFLAADSYGLIVGLLMFISLCVEALMTAVLVTKGWGLELKPREQNILYGFFHIIIAVIYIIVGIVNWLRTAELAYSRAF